MATDFDDLLEAPPVDVADGVNALGFEDLLEPAAAPEAVADTGQSRLASAGNEALKSLAKVGTGTLSALSELPGFFARNLTPLGWAAAAGNETAKKAIDVYTTPTRWMGDVAKSGEASLDENLPTNPKFSEEYLASKIPNVVGQVGGQLATALIPAKWAQLGSKAVQAIGLSQAGLLGLDSGYKEAQRLGVTDPVKRDILATIYGGVEAGTEAFGGFGGKSLSKALTGEIRDLLDGTALKTIAKTAAGEGLEEVAAEIPTNIASTVFAENDAPLATINPLKSEYWSNLAEAFGLGSIGGGIFGGVQATANRKTASNAMAMRASVANQEEEFLAKQAAGEALSPEEQTDLTEMKGYDSRLSAWLESQGLDQASQQAGLVTARAISSATRAGMPATADALRVSAKAAADQKIAAIRAQLNANEQVATPEAAPVTPEATPAAPITPAEPIVTPPPAETVSQTEEVPVTVLTPDAEALLQKADSTGAIPAFISPRLEKIASDNGITVTGSMTPRDVVAALRAKKQSPPPPDASLQPPPLVQTAQESPPQNDATPLPAESVPLQVPATEPQLTPNVLGAVGEEFARRGQEALDRGDEASAESHANAGAVMVESLKRWGAAFPGVKFVDGLRTSMAVNPNDGQLLVDPKYISEGLADGRYTPKSLDTAMNEEAVHNAVNVATARMMEPELGRAATPQEVNARHAEDWSALPDRVRQESERLYNLTAIERARVESGKKSLTEQEIRDVISQVQAADWQRGAEFKRQVMQGRIWGVITEEAQKNKNFSKWLTDFLNELLVAIKDISKRITDPAALKRLDDLEREVRDVLAKLGVTPAASTQAGDSTSPVLSAAEPVADTSDLEDLNAVIAEERETATLREQAAKPKSIDEVVSLLDRSAAAGVTAKALAQEVASLAGNRLPELQEALGIKGSAQDIANQLLAETKKGMAQKRVEESAPVQEKAVRVEGDEIGERPLTKEEKLERRVGETEEAPEGMRDEDVEERLSASPPVEAAVNNKDRLKQLADWFRRTSSQTQDEGTEPANATKEERERKATGEKVSEYRPPMTKAEIDQNFREMLARSAQESILPFNKRFGEKVLAYLEDKGDLEGIPRTDMMQVWLGIQLQNNVNGIATRLGIDPRKAESPTQAALSRAGTTLGLAVETLYKPIQRLRKEAQEVSEKKMKKEGIENDQKFAEDINKPVEQTRQDQLADVQKVMSTWFEDALPSFGEKSKKGLERLRTIMTRISELRQRKAALGALSASQPVGSPEPQTIEDIDAELAALVSEADNIISEIFGTKKRVRKAKPKAEQAEKEIKAAVEAAEEAVASATFTEWVSGAEQDGVPKFVDLMSENINAAGFDRDAFMESLLQKFENVDPDLIEDVANRVGDALDAKTEEATEAEAPDYDSRAKRVVALAVADDSSAETEEGKPNPFTVATKKRLREEITAEQYLEELAKLNVEPQSAFAMNRKVERDISELKAKAFQRKDAAERKRLQEQYAKKAEADTNRLAKELSDTTPTQKKKVLDDLDKLKADFMNPKGPPISEEMFLEQAAALNIPEEIAKPYVKLLAENRRRIRLDALVELQQQDAKKTQAEKDKINAEAERKIAALANQLSDIFPPKTNPKALEGLNKLIADFSGKNGPPITEEMFRAEAEKLGMDEGQLDRLTSILEESRRRDYLVAITKLDQAEKDKLVKEQKQRDAQAQREIDAISDKYLSAKTQSAPTEFRKLVNSYKDLEIGEAELRAGLQKLGISPKMIDSLMDSLKVDRAAKVSQNWRKIVDAVAKARTDAINRAVNTMKRVSKPKDAPKRSGFVKALTAAAEAGVLDSNAVRDAFSEAYDLHGLTQERMEALADILRRIEAMPEGIPKETLLELAHSALNDIAPSSTIINWLYQNLLGGVLSGASTIVSQFSQLSAVLNPFQATYQFMVKAGGRPMRNPGTFARVWGSYLREAWRTIGVVPVGMQGIAGGQVAGLGVSPSPMASFRPQQQQLSRFGPFETWKFRVGRADWVKAITGTEPKTKAGRILKGSLLFPSWMAGRSFNMIRGAEAWTGSIDRNMEARALLMKSLVDKGMSVQKAYNQVSDKFNQRTNKVEWDEALAGADKDIAAGLVAKGMRKQRAEEIMQDRIDAEWNANLKNRHRMMSAWRNFKDDPITTPGLWFAKDVMGKAPTLVKSVFLFSRFFANSLERAIFNSPLGYIHMSKATAAKGAQTELHKRIEAMFGSLENYRQYRNGLATSSVVSTFVMTTALALAWAFWKWGDDDDEGEPPVFWITGATPPSSPYATGRQLAAAGWWQPNTLVLNLPGMEKPLLLNYVQGNPELAITLAAVGNVADRIMFPELLTYSTDPRTGERSRSMFKTVVQPFTNALVSPATRSTYVTTQQAIQRALEGDPKGLAKLISRPAGEVAAATVLGGPGVRDLRKAAMPDTPRAAQTWKQALASGVPFADAMGMDTGAPMLNSFGESVVPFSHIPFISAAQESSDSVKGAAKILNDIGITKEGPQEWMTAPDLYEVALNGERVLLTMDERGEVLGDIGMRFARAVNENERKIRGAKEYDDKKKVVQDLMKDARAQVLRQWRHKIKKED